MKTPVTVQDWARKYIFSGYSVVPIPSGQKGPVLPDWLNLRLGLEQVPQHFTGDSNIGIILGPASHNLIDVDLDCEEARLLADTFLPATDAVSGRPSAPRSHFWYHCPDLTTFRIKDPYNRSCIVECRGEGCQTVVGPSVHPSGEKYYPLEGQPANVDIGLITDAVRNLANAVVWMRHGEEKKENNYVFPPSSELQRNANDAKRRAEQYVGKCPGAISGQSGHLQTFKVALYLVRGFLLTEVEAMDIMVRIFNPKCSPPWKTWELEHKVRDAAKCTGVRAGWLMSK